MADNEGNPVEERSPVVNLYYYHEVIEFGPNEPQPYANSDISLYVVGTTDPAPVYSDYHIQNPIPNSIVTTNEFGEIEFFSTEPNLDFVRAVGGRRTTIMGDPGGADELRYTRMAFFT